MRIALTITELDPGGAEKCLVDLAVFLKSKGHDVLVCALGRTSEVHLGTTPDRSLLTKRLDAASVPWMCGPADSWHSLPGTVYWLQRELGRFQPNVVQSMLFHANVITALANVRMRVPHYGGERVRQVQSWRKWISRWAIGRMEKLVCVSQSISKDYTTHWNIQAESVIVIPNGIPGESLQLEESEVSSELGVATPFDLALREVDIPTLPETVPSELLKRDLPVLLFVGRLTDQKGIEALLLRAEELLSRIPNAQLVVLGDGPLKARLQQVISSLSVRSRIHLLGWQPNVDQWMRICRVLLLPSTYEGMPNVVLEAMNAARPVVCFDVDGVQELLGNPSCGQIVQQGNWAEFVQVVQKIVGDRHFAVEIGSNNFQRVRRHFLLDDQLSKYEQLYLATLDKNR